MTPRGKRIAALAACLVLAAGAAFGQGLGTRKTYTLTITVNVPNARILVDLKQISGNRVTVVADKHRVTVQADGYAEVTQIVDVTGDMTVPIRLVPLSFPLTVRANITGFTVYIDGAELVNGSGPVPGGQHDLLVQAPGYKDYEATIVVNAPQILQVAMELAGFPVTVKANVAGAVLTVNNGDPLPLPWSDYLPKGTYTLRVSADGFVDYVTTLVIDKALTVAADLKLRPTTLTVAIPNAFLDPDQKVADAKGQVKVYVDGKQVNANKALEGIAVTAGKHRIRVSSGGLSLDLGDVLLSAGVSYVIDLSLGAQLRVQK